MPIQVLGREGMPWEGGRHHRISGHKKEISTYVAVPPAGISQSLISTVQPKLNRPFVLLREIGCEGE